MLKKFILSLTLCSFAFCGQIFANDPVIYEVYSVQKEPLEESIDEESDIPEAEPLIIKPETVIAQSPHSEKVITPKAAQESTSLASNSFRWGICIGGIIVIGLVAGLVAGFSSTSVKASH